MKKSLLICLLLGFLSMKCTDDKILQCSDCYDRETVLEAINKIAEKKLGNKIDDFEVKIEEETNFYTITYTNIQSLNDPLKRGGGGFLITISKKDCKIVDYKIFA